MFTTLNNGKQILALNYEMTTKAVQSMSRKKKCLVTKSRFNEFDCFCVLRFFFIVIASFFFLEKFAAFTLFNDLRADC